MISSNDMKAIAMTVDSMLPENQGFIILTYPHHVLVGNVQYISNSRREDAKEVLLKYLEEKERTG